jgi:hypothetical protein
VISEDQIVAIVFCASISRWLGNGVPCCRVRFILRSKAQQGYMALRNSSSLPIYLNVLLGLWRNKVAFVRSFFAFRSHFKEILTGGGGSGGMRDSRNFHQMKRIVKKNLKNLRRF